MGVSNRKKIKRIEIPQSRRVVKVQNPDQYYSEHPAWGFNSCDPEMWKFAEENIGNAVWSEIFPYLQNLEKRTWNDILLVAKKQNHSIDAQGLNAVARKRLAELYVEQDSIISLRISATHRLYGFVTGRVFNILWYDNNHGDNETCVCRAQKKHT